MKKNFIFFGENGGKEIGVTICTVISNSNTKFYMLKDPSEKKGCLLFFIKETMIPTHDRVLWVTVKVYGVMSRARWLTAQISAELRVVTDPQQL